ncbi:monovalent cation/H(+) antiporter subunit G [Micromonospora sp. NPDC000207]|uniref:cation:proton antiporter n=1 Tax=Micromonospora sp. NPDC000207 TaxID=3154246 RepID=UPI0033203293
MSSALTVVGNAVVVLGALVFATAALGIVRFPDPYTRISAVGTAGGFGIVLVVTGALLVQPSLSGLVKVVAIVVLHLTTSAIGTIALARSAHLTGARLRRRHFDELATAGADDPTRG